MLVFAAAWDVVFISCVCASGVALTGSFFRARYLRKRADEAIQNARIDVTRLIAIDAIRPRESLRQYASEDLLSQRYGLTGRPDLIVRSGHSLIPIE
jgi:hypothetical protein